MSATCSRADLARLLGAPDAQLINKCASLLGFESRPTAQRPRVFEVELVEHLQSTESLQVGPAGLAPVAHPVPKASFFRIVAAAYPRSETGSELVPDVSPPWEDADQGNTLKYPEAPPLVSWPRLWRRLRMHLSQKVTSQEVDLPRLLSQISQAESVTRLPRRVLTRLPARPQVLVDRTRRQMPFWTDQDRVCASLAATR